MSRYGRLSIPEPAYVNHTQGFLFRAQPALMTAEPSAKIMDSIFASPVEEARGRLLKILQDFLVSEAAKHAANEKGMSLRGNTFARLRLILDQLQRAPREKRRLQRSTWKS